MDVEPEKTLVEWSPTPRQRIVAEYLAAGYSQKRAAEVTGSNPDTISDWLRKIPQFEQLVMDRTLQFLDSTDVILEQSIALAQRIVLQSLTGEIDGRDPSVTVALQQLRNTIWRVKGEQTTEASRQENSEPRRVRISDPYSNAIRDPIDAETI